MGWWFAIQVLVFYGSFMVQRYLAPSAPGRPQPKALSDFGLPTVDGARAIPVVFGRCKVTGPNLLWYGNFGTEIYNDGQRDVGYSYYLGLDLGVCHGPVDRVRDLLFDDTSFGFDFHESSNGASIYHVGARRGLRPSGGDMEGHAWVYPGGATQAADPYLLEKAGSTYPGYPHLCHVVLRNNISGGGFQTGTSEYLRAIAVDVERYPNALGLTGDQHKIVSVHAGEYDVNPACMIHEILTDTTWGAGVPAASLDLDSFTAAGETLYDEHFGLAMMLERPAAATEVIGEILRHIDGELYADPTTGKLVLRLVRGDYDPDTIPVLDESCVESVEFSRRVEVVNAVRVTYTDQGKGFTPRTAEASDPVGFRRNAAKEPLEQDFLAISNPRNAGVVSNRLLRANAFPFATLKLVVDRSAWRLRPVDVFKFDWPPLGIVGMICRVVRPAGGTLTSGKITLDCVEDVFGYTGTAYEPPAGDGWTDPISDPVAAVAERLLELPYQLAPETGRAVTALAARADSSQSGFKVWADLAGGTAYAEVQVVGGFLPTGTLTAIYPADTDADDATGFELEGLYDVDRLTEPTEDQLWHGLSLALVGEEIVGWRTIDGTGSTRQIAGVVRGLYDTVPVEHALGTRVWFLAPGPGARLNPGAGMLEDDTVAAKLLLFTLRATLDLADAARLTLATHSRALEPLPPGKVRINDVAWPDTATGDVVVTWAHRHRTVQAAAGLAVSQDADDQAATPEGSYKIEVWVGLVMMRFVLGLTSTTWTWTTAMQTADGATVGSAIHIRITPINGSLTGPYQERSFVLA
jgi:hypothetical protein